MIDYSPKEIIDAGFELIESAKRARRADRKADLKRQAYILFDEVGFKPGYLFV